MSHWWRQHTSRPLARDTSCLYQTATQDKSSGKEDSGIFPYLGYWIHLKGCWEHEKDGHCQGRARTRCKRLKLKRMERAGNKQKVVHTFPAIHITWQKKPVRQIFNPYLGSCLHIRVPLQGMGSVCLHLHTYRTIYRNSTALVKANQAFSSPFRGVVALSTSARREING